MTHDFQRFDITSAPDDDWTAWRTSIFYLHGEPGETQYRFQFDYYTQQKPTKAEIEAFLQDAAVKAQQQVQRLRDEELKAERMEQIRSEHY